jgi:hypothetical protein
MQHTEALLMALIVGLYLYDSALLLYPNEALLLPVGARRWQVGFGSSKTTFMGRELYVPNPFLPTRRMFRVAWDFDGSGAADASAWSAVRDVYGRLSAPVWSMAVLMFVILPAVLFGRLGDMAILLSFSLIYLNVLLIILVLWLNHESFQLSNRAFALLAFDFLICPPFALNVIRRLSLRAPVQEDLIRAARRLLAPADWDAARSEALSRLDDAIAYESEGSSRMRAMLNRRSDLTCEDLPCPQ